MHRDLEIGHVRIGVKIFDDRRKGLDEGLGRLDVLREGHRPSHWHRVRAEIHVCGAFGQTIPAAHDLGSVIEGELMVLVGQRRLQPTGDRLVVDAQDHDLVVGEQVALDGLTEPQPVKLRAVHRFVVHRRDDCRVVRCLALGLLAVDARCRRHVQPFGGRQVVVVVHLDEGRLVGTAGKCDAGGAMRLVTQDEVELLPGLPLGPSDDVNGLVGGEDDGHLLAAPTRRLHLLGKPGGIGRRQRDVVGRDVLGLAGRLGVGAHDHRADPRLGLRHPLPQGLTHQCDAGSQEEHLEVAVVVGTPPLGKLERGERLARPAGRDPLAPVMVLEPLLDLLQCLLLVRTQPIADGLAGLVGERLRREHPVDRRLGDLGQANALHGHGLMLQRLLGIPRPVIGGRDDDAIVEPDLVPGLARRREERVDVLFLQVVPTVVELALDRGPASGVSVVGHQVDARVVGVLVVLPPRPGRHLVILGGQRGVGLEVRHHEFLELRSALGRGWFRAESFDDVMDAGALGHDSPWSGTPHLGEALSA